MPDMQYRISRSLRFTGVLARTLDKYAHTCQCTSKKHLGGLVSFTCCVGSCRLWLRSGIGYDVYAAAKVFQASCGI